MRTATEATPEMAAYFLGALRDQSSRAVVFQRQIRWHRLRSALAAEEALVAEQHLLDAPLAQAEAEARAREVGRVVVPLAPTTGEVTTSAEPPASAQAAAG